VLYPLQDSYREIRRCLARSVARQLYRLLEAQLPP
jgi:hypothetical protein